MVIFKCKLNKNMLLYEARFCNAKKAVETSFQMNPNLGLWDTPCQNNLETKFRQKAGI